MPTAISPTTPLAMVALDGGAIYNRHGKLTVVSSTFSGNSATGTGGGIGNRAGAVDFSLRSSIVANNDAPEASGVLTSGGYNLIGGNSGSSGFGPTDVQNVDPALDPDGLQDNGGPTKTIALLNTSPAIDAVSEGCPPPSTDQRGITRPQDGDGAGSAFCDIGAFERRAPSSQ